MVLDQMADATVGYRETEERGKLRMGLKEKEKKTSGTKRTRNDDDDDGEGSDNEKNNGAQSVGGTKDASTIQKKKVKIYGKKQPNPLSVMKSKKKSTDAGKSAEASKQETSSGSKKRRKRTHGGSKEGAPATEPSENAS